MARLDEQGNDQAADPEAELRRRIAGQVSADPSYDAGSTGGSPSAPPVDPAPFDGNPSAPVDGTGGWGHTPDYFPGPEDLPANPGPIAPPQGGPQIGISDPPWNPSPSETTPQAPPPSDPYASLPANYATVRSVYQELLGRDPENTAVVAQWLNGTHGDMNQLRSMIAASDEAKAYKARSATTSTPGPAQTSTQRPTGGSLTDPAYAARYVAWAATQPGVNPSVKNDPGYWIGRFTSGAFKNDQDYALMRMMMAEGAPEGANTANGSANTTRVVAPTGSTTGSGGAISAPTPTTFAALSGGSSGPQGVWNSDFVQKVRQMLMGRLSAASQPVDPNDPSITAPMNAARDEASRASDKERTQLAEHLYAQGGLNTDAIGQKIQQSGEKTATGLSSLRATLITRELQSKRDELKSLLQMALQSGDAESAQAIQLQMSELEATLRREGMGVDLAKYQAYLNALASEQVMN